MSNPLSVIEQKFYKVRDFFWNYPEYFIGDERSVKSYLKALYKSSLPYSHFVGAFILVFFVFLSIFVVDFKALLKANNNDLIEAVVMGVDDNGSIQKLTRINPILPSNVQLERDLSELIYEPLIRYEYNQTTNGVWQPTVEDVLAESVIKIREGADYQFNLRKDVVWHDGVPFTADDVIKTFDLISQIEGRNEAYIRAIKQLRWEELNPYTVRVCTKGSSDTKTCNQTLDNPIFSNFLELISIKIIPAHKTKDITTENIDSSIPELFRSPVGTGKYEFFRADDQSVKLVWNDRYYGQKTVKDANGKTVLQKIVPNITTIEFRLFKTIEDAVVALENGTVHTFASNSTQYKVDLSNYPQIIQSVSPVLETEYWSMYFNLRKDPNGNALGATFFQDQKVRTAISEAIDRRDIIQNALQGVGDEALGPIPQVSEYFNKDAGWKTYNPADANKLLDAAGWTFKNADKYRSDTKGNQMAFSLYFVNTYDRLNVAKAIKRDLELVGINVIIDRRDQPGQDTSSSSPDGWSLDDINNQFLSPRLFDAILYGMDTFIDPDRYELFDSTQDKTGLNISGYIGSVPSVRALNQKLVALPKVDKLLEDTRRLDPDKDKKQRVENYNIVQQLIAQDAPVVFLYHPQFIYYVNSRIAKIDLTNVSSLETRFRNIENFQLQV